MIIENDCLSELQGMEPDSIDTVITDPPYGYSFMGKDWDKSVPSVDIWRECLRVLKPGAFMCVISAPRSKERTRVANNNSIAFTYEGKSKSQYKSEAISSEAKQLNGSYAGFQPKPAVEVIIVAMKPLSKKTFVDQALLNRKGISWLDDGRIPTEDVIPQTSNQNIRNNAYASDNSDRDRDTVYTQHKAGRFPANLLVSDDVLNDGAIHKSGGSVSGNEPSANTKEIYGKFEGRTPYVGLSDSGSYSRFFNLDAWAKTLPFLAVPKAAKSEKGSDNHHPTVKPVKLMSYLVTLFSRPGDIVLDPFAGSGSTCIAAAKLNRRYIGIEREAEYVKIAQSRLKEATKQEALL